ncbi:hypothetical protein [Marivita sp. S0852]|uniref:hypothetical protein n=1 Tax=Marivita sp. S0852 TaxID=3373893 RepID=UPI0039826644
MKRFAEPVREFRRALPMAQTGALRRCRQQNDDAKERIDFLPAWVCLISMSNALFSIEDQ